MLNIGKIFMTPGARDLAGSNPFAYVNILNRHRFGDWGDVHPDDAEANDYEVQAKAGGGFLSVYYVRGEKVWVSTVGYGTDECYTTIMLPSEY